MSTYLRPVVCSTPRLTHSEVTTVGQKHNTNNLARDGATWSGTSSALSPPLLAVCAFCVQHWPVAVHHDRHRVKACSMFLCQHIALVTNCDFLNLRMLCTITTDSRSLWMRFRFAHVLYMYLAFAYMYLAFAYMYFTCSSRIKSGRSHGVNPNPNKVLTPLFDVRLVLFWFLFLFRWDCAPSP